MQLNTIKKKLLLLIILAIGGSMLLAGLSLSYLIKKNYEESTRKVFDNYFERAANTFSDIHTESRFYAKELAGKDSIRNALNLVSEYANTDDYQSIIFDEEKKNIARTLLSYAKSTQLHGVRVYDNHGWLVAYSIPHSLSTGIVSFSEGKPIIFISKDGEKWDRLEDVSLIPEIKITHAVTATNSQYIHTDNTVGIEAISPILRLLPDGTEKNIGRLFLINPINESILNTLSKGSQADHGIILPNGKSIGDDITGFSIKDPVFAPDLINDRKTTRHKWLDSTDYFIKAFSIPLANDEQLYLVSRLNRQVINKQINDTLLVVFSVFAISAMLLLPIGLLFARYSITRPIDKLVLAAKSIGEGQYQALNAQDASSDELRTLTEALNSAAITVKTREEELLLAHNQLEKRVEERTEDLSVSNRKLQQENIDRLFAETRLNESTQMLQLVMDNIPQLIFWKDINSVYLGCNQNFLEVSGFNNPEDIVGKTDYDMPWTKNESDFYRMTDRQIMDTDTAEYKIQETQQTASGLIINVETNKIPLHDKNGQVIGILGTYENITERKHAEAILAENEAKFRGIFELSPIGIALNSMDGNFIEANPAFLDFTGYTQDELLTQSYWELTPEKYMGREKEQLNLLNSTGSYGPYEKEFIHKDGHRFPVLLEGRLIKNSSGELNIFSMIQDITNRKIFETELINAKNTAEKANMAKSDFLSSMSHELRTPMNAILGFAQLMELNQSGTLTSNEQENIKEILDAGYHLLDLINEVLDLSRIEAGGLSLSMEEINVQDIVSNCLKLIQSLAESHNILLINETKDCEQLFVHADYTRLKQVLINLASNAIKYNKENGKVTLRCSKDENNCIRFNVIDSGIGISQQNIEKLFKPFERLDIEHHAIDGTGIGLVISKQLVEHMGGHIGVESKKDEGSTFWFSLPCYSPDNTVNAENDALSPAPQAATKPSVAQNYRTKILYIEDNPANLLLMQNILAMRPDTTLSYAENADAGIAMAQSDKPDLILMDIQLPGKDGNEAFMDLQKNEETRTIPVIAVSANAMQSDIDHSLALGFKGYITKPVDIKNLSESIDNVIQ